mmetsp:Transcript_14219/g.29639  ORF Transcript_14219/g.29639 Transcript_14219/m.29639 type:complete len:636 (+) Transcript_14219:19-1926(+)
MDFRSQLSAFKSKGSNGSSNNSNNGNRGYNNTNTNNNSDRGRSSSNSHSNRNANANDRNSYYSNHSNRINSPGRSGGYNDGGGYGGDRRRHRPREWSQNADYHHGPPTARRRFHPPRHGSPGQHHGYGHGHGPPNLDGLGEMRNLGYQIPRGFPRAPTKEEKSKKSKHLALLAIVIDGLPYEEVWKGWCETLSACLEEDAVDEYFISFVCHAKFPQKIQSEWLRRRLLTFPPKQGRGNSFMDPVFLTRKPEWGSVDITRAMLDLLQDGLKIGKAGGNAVKYDDKRFCASRYLARSPPSFETGEPSGIPPVDQFLFLSESCLPVVTPLEFFSRASDPNVSWLNARHRTESGTPQNKYEDDQFAGINRRVPGQYRWKGDQWVLLAKRHAESIIGIDRPFKPPKHQLWQSFRHINASDEMFFPTAMALLGDLRYTKDGYDTQKGRCRDEESSLAGDSAPSETNKSVPETATHSPPPENQCIRLKPVTYTDWTEGMKNPALFSNGPTDLKRVGKLAREMGCLVARKFATHIDIPGVPAEEQKITGSISMEDWAAAIKEIRDEEEASGIGVHENHVSRDEGDEVEATNTDGTTDSSVNNDNNDDSAEGDSELLKIEGDRKTGGDEPADDDDDDEEENQLE